jgi:hypothetical protein
LFYRRQFFRGYAVGADDDKIAGRGIAGILKDFHPAAAEEINDLGVVNEGTVGKQAPAPATFIPRR